MTSELKGSGLVDGAHRILDIADVITPLAGPLTRYVSRTIPMNLVITNIPGPPVPLYLRGARFLRVFPYVEVIDNEGLTIAVCPTTTSCTSGSPPTATSCPTWVTSPRRSSTSSPCSPNAADPSGPSTRRSREQQRALRRDLVHENRRAEESGTRTPIGETVALGLGGVSLECRGCGRENRADSRFCDACGSALAVRCSACDRD